MNQNLAAKYAPCPKCSGANSEQMSFTWWGGILGPKLLTHVKCKNCSHAYNGKTGKDNTTGIIIYSIVVGGLAIAAVIIVIAVMILLAMS